MLRNWIGRYLGRWARRPEAKFARTPLGRQVFVWQGVLWMTLLLACGAVILLYHERQLLDNSSGARSAQINDLLTNWEGVAGFVMLGCLLAIGMLHDPILTSILRYRRRRHRCLACGYQLFDRESEEWEMSDHICPECGWDDDERVHPWLGCGGEF